METFIKYLHIFGCVASMQLDRNDNPTRLLAYINPFSTTQLYQVIWVKLLTQLCYLSPHKSKFSSAFPFSYSLFNLNQKHPPY